jgi:GntR family transcriptional regulator, transcriptional repressor for pyruvate dehydrogenase complex
MIQTRILGHDTDPGDRLPTEKQLTADLAVSRSVVREALRLLEAMGMVKVKKGRGGGIFVSHGFHEPWRNSLMALIKNGRVTFDEVFEARLEIEPSVAVMACRRASKQDLAELRSLIADSREHFDDAKRLRANNLGFHERLAEAGGNPILAMMAKSNLEILEELVFTYLDLPLERHFVDVHEGILEAVERGDELDAETRTRNDILQVKAQLTEIIKKPTPRGNS